MQRRVVITGMGVVAPNGQDLPSFWGGLVEGRSYVRRIAKFDPCAFPSQMAAEVSDFDPSGYIDRKELRRMDRYSQFAVYSALSAVEDAGLDADLWDPERVGVIFGSGIGGLQTLEDQHRVLLERGPDRVSPFLIPMLIADIAAGLISIHLGAKGPNFATVSACASASHAIGVGYRSIREGESDVVITGGAEAPITPLGLAGFCAARALSTRNEEPEKASRPFDAQRDGFVMGEGAGALVLENLEHARARGARVYAELVGVGFTGDAYHITAPPPEHEGAARAMEAALQDAGARPEEVDYINAHGTSTPANDSEETKAIKKVFGEHAYRLAISSTKSMIGHLLGASGAVELIATVLTVVHGVVPPTINYENLDPECDLDYVPNWPREMEVRMAMSNSFGFGGHNAVLLVRRFEGGGDEGL